MRGFIIQLHEVGDLADAFPGTQIVLNHVGSPILGGPYAGDRAKVFTDWKVGMTALAKRPNVTVKLGALPIRLPGAGSGARDMQPASEEVAAVWRPWLETSIELFGADRCMFESNFPVQKRWSSYQVTWNAFKRIAATHRCPRKPHCLPVQPRAFMAFPASRTFEMAKAGPQRSKQFRYTPVTGTAYISRFDYSSEQELWHVRSEAPWRCVRRRGPGRHDAARCECLVEWRSWRWVPPLVVAPPVYAPPPVAYCATAGRLLSPAAGLLSPVAPRVGAAALGRPLLGARPLGISTMAGVAARYAGKKPHRADDGRVE